MILAIPLVILAGLLVALGSAVVAKHVSNGLTGWVIGVLKASSFLGVEFGKYAVQLASWLSNELGKHYASVVKPVTSFFVQVEQAIWYGFTWPYQLARLQYDALKWLLSTGIPRLVKGLTHDVVSVVHGVTKITRVIERRIVHVTKYVVTKAVNTAAIAIPIPLRPFMGELNWIRKHWKALTAALGAGGLLALPIPWGQTIRNIRRRIRALEHKSGALAIATTLVGAVAATSWLRMIRCPNVLKTGKQLCRVPGHLLDDFLNLLADFFILENICTIIPWLEAGVSEIATPLVVALTDVGVGLCDPSSSVAAPMPVPRLYLSASVASLTAGV